MSIIESQDLEVPTIENEAPETLEAGQPQDNGSAEVDDGYDITFDNGVSDTPEVSQNAVQAAKRIARKKQREYEAQLERLKAGEVDESLRVNAETPAQPDVQDFLGEDALSKYGYDTNIALAAFNAAQSNWMIAAQNAQQAAQVKQSQNVNQYLKQSEVHNAVVKEYYDNAEKLKVADFDEIEDRVTSQLPAGWHDTIVNNFPDKAAAMFIHFDRNPAALASLLNSQRPLVDATRLADRLTITPRSKVSKAPIADSPLEGGNGGSLSNDAIRKKMDDAANSGNTTEYRRLKTLLK